MNRCKLENTIHKNKCGRGDRELKLDVYSAYRLYSQPTSHNESSIWSYPYRFILPKWLHYFKVYSIYNVFIANVQVSNKHAINWIIQSPTLKFIDIFAVHSGWYFCTATVCLHVMFLFIVKRSDVTHKPTCIYEPYVRARMSV